RVPVETYQFDGHMAYHHSGAAPVYAPNSGGRPWADRTGRMDDGWEADGEMMRSAYTLRADDDDFSQPGALVREVFSDAERDALVETVSGALLGGVRSPVLERAFDYWKSIDPDVGRRIEETVRRGHAPEPAAGMSEGCARPPRPPPRRPAPGRPGPSGARGRLRAAARRSPAPRTPPPARRRARKPGWPPRSARPRSHRRGR